MIKAWKKLPAALLIFTAAIIRLYILLISNNCFKADPISRVFVTMKWLAKKGLTLPESGDWLPLHFYIMGAALRIYYNPFFVPKFISFVFGVLSIVVFYKLVHMIFGERISFLSLGLLVFYPIHILCSTVSLSEVIFLFFLLFSFYLFFRYLEVRSTRLLLLSALSLACASMLRYEAWLFILFIPYLLSIEKGARLRDAAYFLFITSILPVLWIASLKFNVLSFKHDEAVGPFLLSIGYTLPKRLYYWQGLLYNSFGPLFYMALVAGLYFSIRAGKAIRYYTAMCLAIFIFFILATTLKYVSLDDCYAISFAAMMFPLSIYGIDNIVKRSRFRNFIAAVFVILTMYILAKDVRVPVCGSECDLIADYLKHNADKDDDVILDHCGLGPEYYYILLKSGLLNGRVFLIHRESRKEILDYIENEKPKYVIASERGSIDSDIIDLLSPRLTKILTSGNYTIYRFEGALK